MKNILSLLRSIAFLEGLSFLVVLFITMPLKYFWDMREPNLVVGMVHGVLFILYCLSVVVVARLRKWSLTTIFWALLASVLPFGTFIADAKIFVKEK